mgnify:CR=1 FL=1
MGYWLISYEMCLESAVATLKQTVVDVVLADSYFEVINDSLRESIERITESLIDVPEGHVIIDVEVIEVKEMRNISIMES